MAPPTGYLVMRDAVVTIDDVEYANQVRKARLVPDQQIQTYKTLVPDGVVQDVDQPVWTLELEGLQINSTGGLADALRDAYGTIVSAVVQPKSGTGQPTATVNILIPAIPFGGEQGAFMDMDLSIPVNGQPVYGTSA